MIAEIIITIVFGSVLGYAIYKFYYILERKRREKNIDKKMEARIKKPLKIGDKMYNLSPMKKGPLHK